MTVSDVFAAPNGAAEVPSLPTAAADNAGDVQTGRRARVRAMVSATVSDGKIVAVLRRLAGAFWLVVRDDAGRSWWSRRSAPTVREVWTRRMPDIARVPGRNRFLWGGWVVYNHAVALPATALLNPAMFVLQHPARLALTVLLLSPLWIFG
jgi:hypothetical protein